MRILLDTNVFLWIITNDRTLSKKAAKAFLDTGNELFLSMASLWEITIKVCLGKLNIPRPVSDFLLDQLRLNGIQILEINSDHIFGLEKLPLHHGDPFDRLILSQCVIEKIPVVSSDSVFSKYPVKVIW